MKPRLLALAVTATIGSAQAGTLERALSCGLSDGELAGLVKVLRQEDAGFARPAEQTGAPSFDIFRLEKPVTVNGLSGQRVALAPGRIVMVIEGDSPERVGPLMGLSQAARGVAPDASPYVPWLHEVRKGVSSIVIRSSHRTMANAALVGCQYLLPDAYRWLDNQGVDALMKLQPAPGK